MRTLRPNARALAALAALAIGLSVGVGVGLGCGNSGAGFMGLDGSADAHGDVTVADAGRKDVKTIDFIDGRMGSDACVNLACQQTCASTSVTGTVYDPAGLVPLYNVFVYVPNTPLAPITSGAVCTTCQAPATGDPLVSASSAADGTFTLKNVPVGADIPIVLQLGKWRRHLTLPKVAACSSTTAPAGFFRFPRTQGESSPDDNIPLIALTTGCDGAECFLNSRIGIDKSEFTSPTATPSGRVHVYKGNGETGNFPGGEGTADTLWGSTPNLMMNYDIVIDACECSTFNRGGAGGTNIGYINFLNYLNGGGRAFTTHYFYNFFSDQAHCGGELYCDGQPPLPTIGAWEQNNLKIPFAPASDCPKDKSVSGDCMTIDTSIPKGMAFAQWYADNNTKLKLGGGEKLGYVGLTDIREDMGALEPSLVEAGTATPWLYSGNLAAAYDAFYFSVNSPVGTDSTAQCGRAIFSDVHLSDSPSGNFPSYCATDPNSSSHAPNELALEFLFFDLSSCVQNDNQPPPPPPQPR